MVDARPGSINDYRPLNCVCQVFALHLSASVRDLPPPLPPGVESVNVGGRRVETCCVMVVVL